MSSKSVFGEPSHIREGKIFSSRRELYNAGVHRQIQAGICGSKYTGAESIVLSGGYDDKDFGNEIIYTGFGGKDKSTGKHISDQKLDFQNLALAISKDRYIPVRVIRGSNLKSEYAPSKGYRYDGLYNVEDYWNETINGYVVIRFKLSKVDKSTYPSEQLKGSLTGENTNNLPQRRSYYLNRIVRNTKNAQELKEFYDFTCQICGVKLIGASGPYAEAAHIKPLGSPHNGLDNQNNILCLCPNHHVLFDSYAFTIDNEFNLLGIEGKLRIKKGHNIDLKNLEYRRKHYSLKNKL